MKRLFKFFQNFWRDFLIVVKPEQRTKTQKCSGCQKKRCVYDKTFDDIGELLAIFDKEEKEEEEQEK